MSDTPRLVQVGSVGGTPVFADVTVLGWSVPQVVELGAPYTMLDPVGFPSRPGFTGDNASAVQYPRVVPAGTPFLTFACEAAALNNVSGAFFPSLNFSDLNDSQYFPVLF